MEIAAVRRSLACPACFGASRQAKADVYALSMGRRVAGKAARRGLVSVQFNDL